MEKITLESLTRQFVELAKETNGNYNFVTAIAEDIAEKCYDRYVESNNDENAINDYIEEVVQYGCVSGAVPMFVYNRDCSDFYTANVLDMDEWLYNLDYDQRPSLESPRFVSLCWFAYETIAADLQDRLYLGYEKDELDE